jgi:hypothetical protein
MAPRPVALKIVRVLLAVAGPLPALAALPAMAADISPAAGAQEPAGQERAEAADAAAGADVPAAAGAASGTEVPMAADTPPPAGEEQPDGKESAASEAPESPWAGTLEIYGFAPLRTTTTATVRGFSATTDVGLGTLLNALTDVFYLRGSVEYERIGLLTDISYVGIGAEQSRSFSRERRLLPDRRGISRTLTAKVATTQGLYDFALRYRFGKRERALGQAGDVTLIPYAGVRVVDLDLAIDTTFEAGPVVRRSVSRNAGSPIVQPLVGVQGQVFLAPRLRLFARGDLGGFSPSGNPGMSGNAQVGLGYAIGNSTQLDLSWRYLYLARNKDTTSGKGYAIDQNGIEAGIKFFF